VLRYRAARDFKVTPIFDAEYVSNDTRHTHAYNRMMSLTFIRWSMRWRSIISTVKWGDRGVEWNHAIQSATFVTVKITRKHKPNQQHPSGKQVAWNPALYSAYSSYRSDLLSAVYRRLAVCSCCKDQGGVSNKTQSCSAKNTTAILLVRCETGFSDEYRAVFSSSPV